MQNGSRFFASLWSRAYVLLTFTALFWAGNAIVARAARELIPPVALAFWRWTIALAIILPFAWRHLRRDAPVIRGNWRMLLVLGALGIDITPTTVADLAAHAAVEDGQVTVVP